MGVAKELGNIRSEGQNKLRRCIHHWQPYRFDSTRCLPSDATTERSQRPPGNLGHCTFARKRAEVDTTGLRRSAGRSLCEDHAFTASDTTKDHVAPVASQTLLAGDHSGKAGGSDGSIARVAGTVRHAPVCHFPSSNSENLAVQLDC